MEFVKHNTLEQYRRDLIDQVADAESILQRLQHAQLSLSRAEPVEHQYPNSRAPQTWLLYYEPEQKLRERFDLAPELLVLLLPAERAQAKDIRTAEHQLLSNYRLDRGLVLVVSRDPEAGDRLHQATHNTGRTYIFQSFDDILKAQDPQRWFRVLLLEKLGSSDLFERGDPVSGWHFVGRTNELQNLRRHLLAGHPVGLYGLRKVGKTSLLQTLKQKFITEAREARKLDGGDAQIVVPIHFDLQTIGFAEPNRTGFLRQLIRYTFEALHELDVSPSALGLSPELGKVQYLKKLGAEELARTSIEVIETLIEWAQEQLGQRHILLILDEYERLLSGSSFPPEHGVQLLDYLRGLVQSYPGTFNFLVAGLSRRQASTPTIANQQNPLFNFLMDFPMAGLVQEEMRELLRKFGKRLSLDFTSEVISMIWAETGGHPYLARQFGRVVDKHVPASERDPKKRISPEMVMKLRPAFRRQVALTMDELLRAVSEVNPRAPFALSYLQSFPKDADAALSELPGKDVEELRRLGLLDDDDQKKIRIGCFGAWLQDNWEPAPRAAVGG